MDKEKIRQTGVCGQRVDALRILNNETKTELVSVIGVSPGHLTDLLQDRYKWSEDKVLAVAEHYQVSFEYLYYGTVSEQDRSPLREEIARIIEKLQKLPEKKRKVIGKMILKALLDLYFDELLPQEDGSE